MVEPSLELLQTLMERIVEGQHRTDEKIDRLIDDTRDPKLRMTASEEAIAGINRRLDRIDFRLDRIERRLELTPAG